MRKPDYKNMKKHDKTLIAQIRLRKTKQGYSDFIKKEGRSPNLPECIDIEDRALRATEYAYLKIQDKREGVDYE